MIGEWTKYFDRIYMITTINRSDRTMEAQAELNKYNIPFTRVYGQQEKIGNIGLYKTMCDVWRGALNANFKRILVFENDVLFVHDPNKYLPLCLRQLMDTDWHIFHLGPNTHQPFEKFVSPNLLPMQKCRSTHAVAYSREGMRQILKSINDVNFTIKSESHIDIFMERIIQPLGECYCSYPFLATQRDGYSDIVNRNVSNDYIMKRYYDNVKHLEL